MTPAEPQLELPADKITPIPVDSNIDDEARLDATVLQVAREVWTAIGTEFNRLRATNRAAAYATKQRRINENFVILCNVMSPRDLLDEVRRCEEFMDGGSSTSTHGSALDELADFLNGGKN
jgi:hypothetical protein